MSQTVVITGASGGMGLEITRRMAASGFRVIMCCRNREKALAVSEKIIQETGNPDIRVVELDLSSLESVRDCATEITTIYGTIDLLMNNAGIIATGYECVHNGLEKTVLTNYVGPYLFTRKLLPVVKPGGRIVNMVSCTCRLGRIDLPDFFFKGKKGSFRRMPVYCNTKLALMLFTVELAERIQDRGISVNAADPGVVSTGIISMDKWFDPLTDLFFRPFIRKPSEGASSAVDLLLKEEFKAHTGCLCVNNKIKHIREFYVNHSQRKILWEETEKIVSDFL